MWWRAREKWQKLPRGKMVEGRGDKGGRRDATWGEGGGGRKETGREKGREEKRRDQFVREGNGVREVKARGKQHKRHEMLEV